MTRTILAGCTDYSHQSLNDMLVDLNEWIFYLPISLFKIDKYRNEIQPEYWEREVSYDLKVYLERARRLCETCQEELLDIRQGISRKVEEHHVTRLRRLAEGAIDLNNNLSRVFWKSKYYLHDNPNFYLLEHLYGESLGSIVDLIDLDNLAMRLKDFIGRENTKLSPQLTKVLENILRAICNMPNNFIYAEDDIKETNFRDYVLVVLTGMGYRAKAEPRRRVSRTQKGFGNEGFIDILIDNEDGTEAIIEFKVWGRERYKEIITQVLGYGTPWTTEYATVMINPNKASVLDKFMKNIRESRYFVDFLEIGPEYSPLQKIVSIHHQCIEETNQVKTFNIVNFIINVSFLSLDF